MGFRGDLKNISLADVFQNIASNRLTGTLRIHDSQEERYLYFQEGAITLFSPGKSSPGWIPHVLVKKRKLNDSQKDSAIQSKKKSKKLLPTVLQDLKLLSIEEYSQALSSYIEEEIYEVFSWKNAHFEFEDGLPPPLFEDDIISANISIDSYTVIMEAARRLDEWDKIRKHISSMEDIFTALDTDPVGVELEEDEKAILPLLNGSSTIQEVFALLPLSKFEVLRAFYDLLQKGLIRSISVEELGKIADARVEEKKYSEAISLLKRAMERERNNLLLRQKLAEVLELEERHSEAADEFKLLAYQHIAGREIEKAIQCYRRAVVLDPSDTVTQEKLFSLYIEHNRMDRAFSAARALASTYQELGMPSKASKVYEKLLMYEETPEMLLLLAKSYAMGNETPSALKRYYQVAQTYLHEGNEAKALEVYELAEALEKDSEGEARKRIEEIRSGLYQKRKAYWKKMRMILTITPILCALVVGLCYEGLARLAYYEKMKKSLQALSEGNTAQAYYELLPIRQAYPYTIVSWEIRGILENLSSITLEQAQKANDRGDMLTATLKYKDVLSFPIQDEESKKLDPKKLPLGNKEKNLSPDKEAALQLPVLQAQKEVIDDYFKKVLEWIRKNEKEKARHALQKLISFLEEQPRHLQHFYLEKSKELLKNLSN